MLRCKYLLLFIVTFLAADTARNFATGYSAVATANDVHAQDVNPAFLPGSGFHSIYAGYSSLFVGVDDNIYQTYILYSSSDIEGFAFGAKFLQLSSNNFSDMDVSLGIAKDFRLNSRSSIACALRPHMNMVQYDGYDPFDPFFIEYGNSKVSFGLDASLAYIFTNARFGLTANNLAKPNIALNDTVQVGKLGRNVITGISYTYKWLTPNIGFSWDEDDPEEKLRYSLGLIVHLFDGILDINGCYRDDQFDLGLSINPKLGQNAKANFDYTYSNPTGTLGDANLTHHHVGIGGKFKKPPKPIEYPEIGIRLTEVVPALVPLTQRLEVPFEIFRAKTPCEFPVKWSLQIEGPINGSDSGTVDLNEFDTNERTIKFTPSKRGLYTFTLVSSTENEKPNDSIPNQVSFSFTATEDLIATISPARTELTIEKLTFISEEEPFVPIIFFDANSAEIPARFDNTIRVLHERLSRNPDIVLSLEGFLDSATDSSEEIALQRVENVKEALVSLGTQESAIQISQIHDMQRERVERKSSITSKRDKVMVSEENRRVELRPMLKGERELIGQWSVSAHIDGISGFIQQHRVILCNNPDVTVQFEWLTTEEIAGSYADISALRDLVRTMIESECSRKIDIPIIIKQGEKEGISLSLSAEKLIYSPIHHAHSAKDFKIPDLHNPISITVSAPKAVKYHDLSIINTITGDTLRHLSVGENAPKENIVWDWKDDLGVLLDPLGKYTIDLSLEDVLGEKFHFTSDTLTVKATESIRRLTESIIIQFAFDDITSTSRYLESRIDYFAKWILRIANNDEIDGATIKVLGHTDPIGTLTRNKELSQMRAEKEFLSLRKHLAAVLGFPNLELLDEWLGERNINIVKQGFADTEPYEIEKMISTNKSEQLLIGDNNFPEGRSINRRVIILIDERVVPKPQ